MRGFLKNVAKLREGGVNNLLLRWTRVYNTPHRLGRKIVAMIERRAGR